MEDMQNGAVPVRGGERRSIQYVAIQSDIVGPFTQIARSISTETWTAVSPSTPP